MAGSSSYNNSNEGSNGNMYPSEGTVRKQKVAVALQYNKGEQAPKILATGKGHLADKIIEKAKESDRKSTRLNSSHRLESRMPSSA